jgi:hypothetical protein
MGVIMPNFLISVRHRRYKEPEKMNVPESIKKKLVFKIFEGNFSYKKYSTKIPKPCKN